jgi:hypothetical protein
VTAPLSEPIKVEPPVENLHSPEDEETHPMDFISEIEDELFSDFGKASNFPIQPKPRVCNSPFQQNAIQPDKPILKEDFKCLSAAMSVEWLREAEISPEVVRLIMSSTLLSYQIQRVMMDVKYNPTVGITIISKSLAPQLYPNMTLCPSRKIFQDPYETMSECCSDVRTVPVVVNESEIFLDFHVYDNPDIAILIGRPTERLFQEMANGSLAMQLDESTQTVSLGRARNAMAMFHDRFEDDPTENPEDTLNHLDGEQGKEPSSIQIQPSRNLLTESSLGQRSLLCLLILQTKHLSWMPWKRSGRLEWKTFPKHFGFVHLL